MYSMYMNHLVAITVMPKWYRKPSMAGTMAWMFVVSKSGIGLYDLDLFLFGDVLRIRPHSKPPWTTTFFGDMFFSLELVPSIKASNSRKSKMRTQDPKITPFLEFLGQNPPQDEKVWWIPPWRQRRRDICNGGWWKPWRICPWSTRLGTWKCRDLVVEVPKLSWLHIDRVIGLPNHFP